MPATYDCIASTTLSSSSATVTFSSIPGTFTDLFLVMNIAPLTVNDNLKLLFNNDTGANYNFQKIQLNSASRAINQTALVEGAGYTTGNTINSWHILSYANTNVHKCIPFVWGNGSITVASGQANWRNTAAITSITMSVNGGTNFSSGSTFALYGIKAA